MVGFKSIGLLFILLFFASCIPQTKQTECDTNEAFNATLRTCVPVMNGPSSFIDIDSFLPVSVLSKYKNDATAVQFSIVVSNPYAQTYTVKWERVYNGTPINLAGTSSGTTYTYTTTPLSLSTQLGTHIITAKVLDSTNSVVDSHSFELKINETPRPIITTASVFPSPYSVPYTPLDADVTYTFDVYNNNAIMVGAGYKTEWKIYRSGALIYSEIDQFPTTSPVGALTPTGYNYPELDFSPSTLGVGSYVINARVVNNFGEIVAEQQWAPTVAHPSLKPVYRRDIYDGNVNPGFTTTSIAYHGIPYSASTTYNFIPTGFINQGDYCVQIDDNPSFPGEGSYAGTNEVPDIVDYVRVDFYIDGSSLIYSATTNAGPQGDRVCLSDASAAVLNLVMFSNTTSTSTQSHTLVARVIDEATGQEYTSSNIGTGLGTYPITWNFQVRPANAAPTVSFTSTSNLSNISCSTATTTSKTCTVTQDLPFTLGIDATDDFYSTSSTSDAVQAKFTYNMVLMRNGSPVAGQTCTKTVGDVSDGNAVGSDFVGPEYLCSFNVASSDVNGSINPALNTYSIAISFCDVDSPIAGTSATCGNTLTYNLNVTEAQTAPTIIPQQLTLGSISADSYIEKTTASGTVLDPGDAADFVTENEAVNFHIKVADTEMDDFQASLYLCTDFTSACATTSLIGQQTVNKTNNTTPTDTVISYTLPENLLPITTPASTNVTTYFKVVVTDAPDSAAGLTSSTDELISPLHFRLNARNYNPAPQFAGPASPAVTATLTTMVGYPLTIDPGTVFDASVVSAENNISYQWYIDPNGGDNSYAAITGATSRVLRWTPSNGIPVGTTVNLALCASDGTVINPLPPAASPVATVQASMAAGGLNPTMGPNCMGSWDVTVRPNAVALNYDNSTTDVASDVAIWQDTSAVAENKVIYSAYADTTGKIFVEKTVFDANGVIYNNNTSGFQTVSFDALQTGTVVASSVKDISISGNSTHLYIAYQAAESSTPSQPRIRIRRIDKQYGGTNGSKTDPSYPHPGKFGFFYDSNPTLTALLPTSSTANISVTQSPSLGAPILVSFLGDLLTGDTLITNGVTATATSAAGYVLCSGPCGTSTNGGLLETFINASSNRALQGITADNTSGSSDTYLLGALSGAEYLDLANYVPGKLGKIMQIGGDWYLPFIDQSTAGSIGHIRMITANSGATSYLNSSLSVTTYTYPSIGVVSNFENGTDPVGNVVIGAVNSSNIVSLSKFDTAGTVITAPVSIFNSAPVAASSLRIGFAVSSNQNYYVAAKVLTVLPSTYDWKFGRYNSSFGVDIEDTLTNLSHNSATTTILDVNNLFDVSIQADASAVTTTNEARLLVTSNNGTANVNLYSVRFRSDNDLSCGYCTPLNLNTESMSSSNRIATTQIFTNMTIGTAGSTATSTENNRNVFFGIYSVELSGGYYRPQMGIFNTQVESIDSTSADSTGLLGHRPPFFGSN